MAADPTAPEHLRPCRILIVDDEVDVTAIFSLLLAMHGYEVTCAANGEEGLASAREAPPDLVLTDLMMPVMDGIGLARALRDAPGTATIPIVLMSGAPGKAGASEVRFDAILSKPVLFERVLDTIRQFLKR
jgi:CheY-like chemotaxis protein